MENLDLNAYGVSEISEKEMQETNGGFWPLALAVAALVIYVVDNWDRAKEGLADGYKASQ